ncbi:MAG: hypothetical protein LC797_23900 [Chloroflexi bacterium]|nr:hypothetical protein [Chloroflexota bacterium]
MLNGLPHPIQIVIRGRPAATLPVVERIKAHGSLQALELAAWLGAHLYGAQPVERERYLVVPAEDLETLSDRCSSLEASLRPIGLPLERIQVRAELTWVLNEPDAEVPTESYGPRCCGYLGVRLSGGRRRVRARL